MVYDTATNILYYNVTAFNKHQIRLKQSLKTHIWFRKRARDKETRQTSRKQNYTMAVCFRDKQKTEKVGKAEK